MKRGKRKFPTKICFGFGPKVTVQLDKKKNTDIRTIFFWSFLHCNNPDFFLMLNYRGTSCKPWGTPPSHLHTDVHENGCTSLFFPFSNGKFSVAQIDVHALNNVGPCSSGTRVLKEDRQSSPQGVTSRLDGLTQTLPASLDSVDELLNVI